MRKELLDSGTDVNSWSSLGKGDHTPLMYAVYMGHVEVARVLVEAGADVNTAHAPDHTVLYHALESFQLSAELVQLLVDAGVDVNHKSLFWTVEFASRTLAGGSEVQEVMRILIDAGADVRARDESGTPVIVHAVRYRNNQLVETLLRSGADIDATEQSSGRTALGLAAAIEAPETVKLLIEWGADLEASDKSGDTPLMIARGKGSEEIAKLLIDAGATR